MRILQATYCVYKSD